MKASAKRRRSKAAIKEEKKAEERQQKEVAQKLASYDEMARKVKESEGVEQEKE